MTKVKFYVTDHGKHILLNYENQEMTEVELSDDIPDYLRYEKLINHLISEGKIKRCPVDHDSSPHCCSRCECYKFIGGGHGDDSHHCTSVMITNHNGSISYQEIFDVSVLPFWCPLYIVAA